VCHRGSLLDGLAKYLSRDTKKFHDNESTHILHNFWAFTHREGESFPPSPLAAPLIGGRGEGQLHAGKINTISICMMNNNTT